MMTCRDGSIGFLSTSNRVNVMLSRAKHGMFILGNVDTLTAKKLTRPSMICPASHPFICIYTTLMHSV